MQLTLNGKNTDLNSCYTRVLPKVKSYVMRNSGSVVEAKDIFQEAVLAAWLNVNKGSFKGDKEEFENYVYKIAKYKWLDVLKSKYKKSTESIVEFSQLKDVNEKYTETETKYLRKAMTELGEVCRKLLKMFYFEKMSLKNIGEKLGYAESVIKTKKYRCMLKLRENYLSNYVNK